MLVQNGVGNGACLCVYVHCRLCTLQSICMDLCMGACVCKMYAGVCV